MKTKNLNTTLILILIIMMGFSFVLFAGNAHSADTFKEAFTKGKPYADIRLRSEFVDQDGFDKEAHSKTLRSRIGFKTDKYKDWVSVIEGEHVWELNDHYNNTVDGKTSHPTVADVENIQINQAYGEFTGIKDTAVKGGRQVITVGNHRLLGHVGWRQNNQVFDAVKITNNSIEDTTLQYGFIHNVNRIFGETSQAGDWESKSHFYNISNSSTPLGTITTYGFLLDFGSDSAINSNQTFGGILSGKVELDDDVTLKYHAEYAHQSDYGDNTTDYGANYFHFAPAIVWKGITTTVGKEVLGNDRGVIGFRTPLATGHKFNGWADKFLTTPADGLKDLYVDITHKIANADGALEFLNGLLVKFQYHNFSSESGTDYGNEIGVFLKKSITENVYIEAKYANYMEDGFGADTQKFIFDIGFKY